MQMLENKNGRIIFWIMAESFGEMNGILSPVWIMSEENEHGISVFENNRYESYVVDEKDIFEFSKNAIPFSQIKQKAKRKFDYKV